MTNHMIKRSNPLASPTGALILVIFLGALGFSLWKDRGLAFSPGPVTAYQQAGVVLQGFSAHADFEKECRYCHLPLKATLGEMCLACHVEIVDQITADDGIHAQIDNVSKCQTCHSDHQGRDFNPTLAAMQFFDHSITRFSLAQHQVNYDSTPITCNTCHGQGDYTSAVLTTCQNCHGVHDLEFIRIHVRDYGQDCLVCHDGVDRMSGFDHASVFPLDGQHAELDCIACHANQRFAGTPRFCAQCHAEPEVHTGLFGLECQDCHSTTAWSPATLLEHTFPLRHGLESGAQPTACATCHPASYVEYTCYGCHEHREAETAQKHSEEGIAAAELPACITCHPNGQEAEENEEDD